MYAGDFYGGAGYRLAGDQVNISGEAIKFVNASVNDWTEVDETGTPITPTPVP